MKNKGFMLIETLIASTIILGALIFLFIQFSTIKRSYDNSFRYNTIPGLYSGKVLVDFISKNGYSSLDQNLSSSTKGYVLLNGKCTLGAWNLTETKICEKITSKMDASHILYVGNNISNLQNDLKNNNYDQNVFNTGFKKFVLSINSIEINQRRRIIVEYKNNTYAVIAIS
ncbi:MAG: hypothetical protein J6G98_04775 [Bacilli bacterium]|nr:hypothetical protein [Bacilli bacterium]